jgi:pimeloyl-ACP methyl ester carboxylesterase
MINFIKFGDGHPVILVHGIGASIHTWEDIAPELVRLGCQVISMDLPGHSLSFKPQNFNEYNVEYFYTMFEEWVNELDLCESIIFVGHSIGAYFVLQYALRHTQKQIKAMILIDPLISLDQFTPMMKLFYRPKIFSPWVLNCISIFPQTPFYFMLYLTNTYFFIFHGEKFVLPRNILKTMAYDYKRANPAIFLLPFSLIDISSCLQNINTPPLILGGSRDQNLQAEFFEKIALSIPNSIVCVIDGNHNPQHSNPQDVNKLLFDFISGFVTRSI